MAQASLKSILVDCLARRIIDNEASITAARLCDDEEAAQCLIVAKGECWTIANLCSVKIEVEAQTIRIQRANAKEAQP